LTCIFNLSPEVYEFEVKGAAEVDFGNAATVAGQTLTLDGNGFAYLAHDGKIVITSA
jgi:alpha-glucosidase